jgi:predicted transcriptional regulator
MKLPMFDDEPIRMKFVWAMKKEEMSMRRSLMIALVLTKSAAEILSKMALLEFDTGKRQPAISAAR